MENIVIFSIIYITGYIVACGLIALSIPNTEELSTKTEREWVVYILAGSLLWPVYLVLHIWKGSRILAFSWYRFFWVSKKIHNLELLKKQDSEDQMTGLKLDPVTESVLKTNVSDAAIEKDCAPPERSRIPGTPHYMKSCPICYWRGASRRLEIHQRALCPKCGSPTDFCDPV
jgi:hypothetical protein